MSRWDIFRWRTLAGGPPCRQGRQRFSHQAFLSNRPKRVPPYWYKRRRGDTELCGTLASCPLSRLAATAPPKGEPSLASPFGGGGLALARTERASCRPHHPLPWLSPLRARAPRSLVPFWLRAHKVKGKVAAF